MDARPAPGAEPGRVPARADPVPRPDGRVRWMARLDPREEVAYGRAVARIAPMIERQLGAGVLADRTVGRGRRVTIQLESWHRARRTWRAEVAGNLAERRTRHVVVTDVHDCFGSISPEAAEGALRGLGVRPDAVGEFLRRFRDDGIRGLPIGPAASAVVANAVLLPMDRALRDAGIHHLRWVDDVIAFLPDRGAATTVIDTVERALTASGLTLNPTKTASLEREEALVRYVDGGVSPAWQAPCDDSAR